MLKLILVLLVTVTAAAAYAQPEPTPSKPPAQREILTVLAYGDPYFESDLWRAAAEEQATYTSATWRYQPDPNFLFFFLYLHFDSGATPEAVANYFSEENFRNLLANYEPWRQTAVCTEGDVTLYEFISKTGAEARLLRYWVRVVSPTRVLGVNAAALETQRQMLDDYSLLLFPDAPWCEDAP